MIDRFYCNGSFLSKQTGFVMNKRELDLAGYLLALKDRLKLPIVASETVIRIKSEEIKEYMEKQRILGKNSITVADKNGISVLMCAAAFGNQNFINKLIKKFEILGKETLKNEINKEDSFGCNAIYYTNKNACKEIINILHKTENETDTIKKESDFLSSLEGMNEEFNNKIPRVGLTQRK